MRLMVPALFLAGKQSKKSDVGAWLAWCPVFRLRASLLVCLVLACKVGSCRVQVLQKLPMNSKSLYLQAGSSAVKAAST